MEQWRHNASFNYLSLTHINLPLWGFYRLHIIRLAFILELWGITYIYNSFPTICSHLFNQSFVFCVRFRDVERSVPTQLRQNLSRNVLHCCSKCLIRWLMQPLLSLSLGSGLFVVASWSPLATARAVSHGHRAEAARGWCCYRTGDFIQKSIK